MPCFFVLVFLLAGFDTSWALGPEESLSPPPPVLVRGPYLQNSNPTQIIVKWRTDINASMEVRYGLSPTNLNMLATPSSTNATTEHEVVITGLTPNTQYYYAVSENGSIIAGGTSSYGFITPPPVGTEQPVNLWVLGDCGTGNVNARAVRDAYYNYMGTNYTDAILMLGDNAYNSGTDGEYQTAVFQNMYEGILKNSVLWSCPGNHDLYTANSGAESGPYYDIFSFPRDGAAGGVPSTTEAYYSFDYANIHFVSLDSDGSPRGTTDAMYQWLDSDLAANTQEWLIAIFHHPPYTKGSHDSDNPFDSGNRMHDMRQNFLPLLESYGVDLVMSGHSHSYERSYLIKDHYGLSPTFDPNTMMVDDGDGRLAGDCAYTKKTGADGSLYITAGSSGKISWGTLNHPVMYYSQSLLGSLAIQIYKNRMDLKFVDNQGNIADSLELFKDVGISTNTVINVGNSITLQSSWPGDHIWSPGGQTTDSITVSPTVLTTYIVTDPYGCLADTFVVSPQIFFPIAYSSFDARQEADRSYVKLDWTLTEPAHNQVFYIERSHDGLDFSEIGSVKAATKPGYAFEAYDREPKQGGLYYRIKQVDAEGLVLYSEVVEINYVASEGISELYINAAQSLVLSFNLEDYMADYQLEVHLTDQLGRRVGGKTITTHAGVHHLDFDVSGLKPGIYTVSFEGLPVYYARRFLKVN